MAKVIHDKALISVDSGGVAWDQEGVTIRETYADIAIAALEALREPSEAMLEAGKPWAVGNAPPNCWVWMIDAALTTGGK